MKYPEYGCVYSKVLEMVLVQLYADIESYKGKIRNRDMAARPPGNKGKDCFTTMIWNQSGFFIKDGYIILSHYYRLLTNDRNCDDKIGCNIATGADGNNAHHFKFSRPIILLA